MRDNKTYQNFKVTRAPSVTLRVPPHPLADGISEESFFANPIIPQIGRENKFSADVFVLLILR